MINIIAQTYNCIYHKYCILNLSSECFPVRMPVSQIKNDNSQIIVQRFQQVQKRP